MPHTNHKFRFFRFGANHFRARGDHGLARTEQTPQVQAEAEKYGYKEENHISFLIVSANHDGYHHEKNCQHPKVRAAHKCPFDRTL